MEGGFLIKGNKNRRILKKCSDGEENVDCWQIYWLLLLSTERIWGTDQFYNVCCIPFGDIFVVVFFAAQSNEQWSAFPANCSKKCLSYWHLLSFTLLKRLTYRTPSSIYSSKNICTAVNRVVEVSKNVLSGFSWCIVSQSDEQRGETIVLKSGNCLQFFPFC